jgi:alpha-D-ribose 1-methylphosphonate 5-triphosphate synthase subunit PhnH
MKAHELQQVRPGFDDLARGSQAVFRTCLESLARPGQVMSLDAIASGAPSRGLTASALVMLSLGERPIRKFTCLRSTENTALFLKASFGRG